MLHRNGVAVHAGQRWSRTARCLFTGSGGTPRRPGWRRPGWRQGGGWVGCRFPGQNQINARSRTLAPKPITWAVPKLPLVQAIHAITATIASTIIMHAKRILLALMALDFALNLLSFRLLCVSVGFRIALESISITIEAC
jgi:hypothetical protein